MNTATRIPPRRAFTLIETLAVVLILSLVIGIAAPSMLAVIRATRLTSAGELVTGKLVEAQGLALTFSSDVELRLYKSPSDLPGDGNSGQFLQLLQWVENDPEIAEQEGIAKLEKIGPQVFLPDGIAISGNTEFSSLWNLENQSEEHISGPRDYIAIRFRPDGSTDLPENASSWHLTLMEQGQVALAELPPNFYTVQVDPVTAKIEVYRPE